DVGDGRLALVQHLYVAAERNGRQPIFGVIGSAALPAHERPAEADRETQHFEPESARDPEMPELVDRDEHADRDDEGENRRAYVRHSIIQTRELPSPRYPEPPGILAGR